MRTIRNTRSDLIEFNVLVYAKDQKKLWEYREMFCRINEKIPWKIEITLANRMETVWNIITMLSEKIDIFISDVPFEEELIEDFDLKFWDESHHIIFKKDNEYIDIYRINSNLRCIEHWLSNRENLEKRMFHAILKCREHR